jgi:methyl-accepting chemotaxis protein
MTIKKRIIYSSIVLLLLFMATGTINWLGNKSVMEKNNLAYILENETMHVQGLFRGINEFIIDEGEPLSIELTNEHISGFDTLHKGLVTQIIKSNSEFHSTIINKISPQWKVVREGSLNFMKDNPWISVDDDKAMLEYGKLTTEAKKLLAEVEILAKESQEDAAATSVKVKNVTTAVFVIIMLMLCFILFNLYRAITSPIKDLSSIAEGFGRGDLSMHMDDSRKDEFGQLAVYFNQALSKLSDMISNIQNISNTLTVNSEKLSESAVLIANNAHDQSAQTGQAAVGIDQMTSSFMDVAKNTASAAESAREASALAFEGVEVINGTVTNMQHISSSASDSTGTIEALGKSSEQIEDIVQVINDIASQTNLLALNAAIEAARAGEQGRGFAVVADEVRKLAEKTATSTSQIGDMIKNIQGSTSKTITSLQGWNEKVTSGLELANKAGSALESIVLSVNNVTEMVQQVATAAEEQSSSANVISSNVESIAELTNQTAGSAGESSGATQALTELIKELQSMVSEFTLRNIGGQEADIDTDEAVSVHKLGPAQVNV